MTAMSNSDFAALVTRLAQSAPSFEPSATYDPDGDCIEFLASPDPFYAERVDDLVTVYYSQETGEVTGSHIKGVSKFLKKLPGLRIEILDGRIKLVHLFRAKLWTSSPGPKQVRALTYVKLIAVAERTDIGAQLIDA